MRSVKHLALLVVTITLVGCGVGDRQIKVDVSEGANPWTNLDVNNDPQNFQFAIVADRTGKRRAGVFSQAVEKLNLLQPEFVMCVGDTIQGGTRDVAELDRQWNEFEAVANKLQMPFFYLAGNHDIGNEVMTEKWQQRRGKSYYHFVYRDVLFLVMNTEDPPRTKISAEQIEYFRKALKDNANVRWTLVFLHKPMWDYDKTDSWANFESLLTGREYTVFSGHRHKYSKKMRHGRRYYGLATTGGGMDGGTVVDCRFDHIAWITMTEDGPLLANILLEGIQDDTLCQ